MVFVSLFALLLTGFAVPVKAEAGTALEVPFIIEQPDGTSFSARQLGDEHFHFISDSSGNPLVQDNNKVWHYIEADSSGSLYMGRVVGSASLANRQPLSAPGVLPQGVDFKTAMRDFVASQNIDWENTDNSIGGFDFHQSASPQSRMSPLSAASTTIPSEIPILIIRIDFADTNIGQRPSDQVILDQVFTKSTSVRAFYQEASNDKLTFTQATDTDGVSDGIVHISLNYKNPDMKGAYDLPQLAKVIGDSLTAADHYIDFAAYDTNGDGRIAATELDIITFWEGVESSYNPSGVGIWAHYWRLPEPKTLDGKKISQYVAIGEDWTPSVPNSTIAAIPSSATLAHEIGHTLGLPDMYTSNEYSANVNDRAVDTLSLMASSWGIRNGSNEYTPTHLDPWSKVKLGFYSTPDMTGKTENLTLYPASNRGQYTAYRINTTDPNRYYLIEARTKTGFDQAVDVGKAGLSYNPNGGVVVWAIDERIISSGKVNDSQTHEYGIMPVFIENNRTKPFYLANSSPLLPGTPSFVRITSGAANSTSFGVSFESGDVIVTFDSNGGSPASPASITTFRNAEIGNLPTTTRPDYIFAGWFTSPSGGTKVTTTTRVTANVTYYAQWADDTLDGSIVTISSALNRSRTLDIPSSSTTPGVAPILWDKSIAANQRWKLTSAGDGYYSLRNVRSGLVLDVSDHRVNNGKLVQWAYNGGNNQLWRLIAHANGSYTITSKLDEGFCIDVPNSSSANGVAPIVWAVGKNQANQQFYLDAVSRPLADGIYTIGSAASSTRVIDIQSSSRTDGAPALLWTKNASDSQKFRLTYNVDTGYYSITAVHSGKVFDVENGFTSVGTRVIQWTGHGRFNQQWYIAPDVEGTYAIHSVASGLALDVKDGFALDGASLIMWPYHGRANQRWIFESS
jgi:M6 family metalloprotease-like protein/uncharacterized repeat protein (TIGR02543 family)